MKRFFAMICLVVISMTAVQTAQAQQDRSRGVIWSALKGLEYEVKAGFNVGGTSPLPLPREIRKMTSYNPTLCFSIEGDAIQWFGNHDCCGILVGVRLETKGMKADAKTKNYSMEIIGDGGERVKGNWTGMVHTKYRSSLVSIPVLFAWKASKRVRLNVGPYVSFKFDGDFSGHVYEGYLRENNPTGSKVSFEGDSQAPYDFSNELRTVQYGVQAGVSWKALRHLTISGDLTWGLNNIFKSDFDTIKFNMYPIYLNIGFGYAF